MELKRYLYDPSLDKMLKVSQIFQSFVSRHFHLSANLGSIWKIVFTANITVEKVFLVDSD